jgi:hypothetical protein
MMLRDNLIRRALSHYLREEWRCWPRYTPAIDAQINREWREAVAAAEDEDGTFENLLKALDLIDHYSARGRQEHLGKRLGLET